MVLTALATVEQYLREAISGLVWGCVIFHVPDVTLNAEFLIWSAVCGVQYETIDLTMDVVLFVINSAVAFAGTDMDTAGTMDAAFPVAIVAAWEGFNKFKTVSKTTVLNIF